MGMTMAANLHAETEPSLTSLVRGIVDDAQKLVKQEIALARREFIDELNKTKQATAFLAIGVGLATLGGILLSLMVVDLLYEDVHLALWLACLIVGGLLAISGIVFLLIARAEAAEITLVPRQTIETLRENAPWIKNRT
jgi:hypothetical protein